MEDRGKKEPPKEKRRWCQGGRDSWTGEEHCNDWTVARATEEDKNRRNTPKKRDPDQNRPTDPTFFLSFVIVYTLQQFGCKFSFN